MRPRVVGRPVMVWFGSHIGRIRCMRHFSRFLLQKCFKSEQFFMKLIKGDRAFTRMNSITQGAELITKSYPNNIMEPLSIVMVGDGHGKETSM